MTGQQKWMLLAIIVPVEVTLAVLARRDLARRTDDQVGGEKRMWRLFVSINPGKSVFYWLGRRPWWRRPGLGITRMPA